MKARFLVADGEPEVDANSGHPSLIVRPEEEGANSKLREIELNENCCRCALCLELNSESAIFGRPVE